MTDPDIKIYFARPAHMNLTDFDTIASQYYLAGEVLGQEQPPQFKDSFYLHSLVLDNLLLHIVEYDLVNHGCTDYSTPRASCLAVGLSETILDIFCSYGRIWRRRPNISHCRACLFRILHMNAFRMSGFDSTPVSIISLIAIVSRFDRDYDFATTLHEHPRLLRRPNSPCVSYLRYTTALATNPVHIQAFARALSRPMIERAAFELARPHMTEICIGLQELNLPALLVVFIIEEASKLEFTRFRRAHTWELACTVKHWHDRDERAAKKSRLRAPTST